MAYPTGTLGQVLEDVDERLIALRADAVLARDNMAANPTTATFLIDNLFSGLRRQRARLAAAAATPGIGEYARAQKNTPTLDVVAEFNAVIAAIDAVCAWISTNFPKQNQSGYLLMSTLAADGRVDRTFTPTETSALRDQLDGLIATIGV